MKKGKVIAVVLVCVLVLLNCVGCSDLVEKFDNEQIRDYTGTMLDAIIADDCERAYGLVDDLCSKEEFKQVFETLKSLLSGIKTYELTLLSINQSSSMKNGENSASVTASYQMSTDMGVFVVDVQTHSSYEELSSFYITPYDQTNYSYTGTLSSMKNATALQWIMLLSNLLAIGLTVAALVDCCRHKVKQKVLFVLLIAIAFVTFGLSVGPTSLRLNFNLGWLFQYSAWIRYGGGTNVVRFMVPVGAIVWFVARKNLTKPAASETLPDECSVAQSHEVTEKQ